MSDMGHPHRRLDWPRMSHTGRERSLAVPEGTSNSMVRQHAWAVRPRGMVPLAGEPQAACANRLAVGEKQSRSVIFRAFRGGSFPLSRGLDTGIELGNVRLEVVPGVSQLWVVCSHFRCQLVAAAMRQSRLSFPNVELHAIQPPKSRTARGKGLRKSALLFR